MGGDKGKGKGEGKARDGDVVYRRPSIKDRDRLKTLRLWPPPKRGQRKGSAGLGALPGREAQAPLRSCGGQPRAQGQSGSSGAGLAPED